MFKPTLLASVLMSHWLFAEHVKSDPAKPFVHPGLLHSRDDLAFIKQKLSTDEEPWKSAWEKLRSAKEASLDYTPKPCAKVVRGVRN